MRKRQNHLFIFFMALIMGIGSILPSCRDIEPTIPPSIQNDSTSYQVKVGSDLIIKPKIKTSDKYAVYSWTMNGQALSSSPELVFNQNESGTYYVTLKVVTNSGTLKQEYKIEVVDLQPPMISLENGNSVIVEVGEPYTFKPIYQNKKGMTVVWKSGNQEIAKGENLTFTAKREGSYNLKIVATNEDGSNDYIIKILAVAQIPLDISFDYSEICTSVGRTVRIVPNLNNLLNVQLTWYINGKEVKDHRQGATENGNNSTPYSYGTHNQYLVYTPSSIGTTKIRVVANKGTHEGSKTVTLKTVAPEQTERIPTVTSSPYSNKVFEYLPAPGQFINDGTNFTTMQEAVAFAQNRLDHESYVSLGGFGGTIIVGFDHSIKNGGDYDFAIEGNSFDGSSEPGIVWVMQDENGNGIPDDTWYELRGSETGKVGTIQDYEVTYYRPTIPKSNTLWTDNLGNKGNVEWLSFHQQDYYYPEWVTSSTYVLRGTRLKSKTFDKSGNGTYWVNPSFDWGYADNFSPIDRLTDDINYNAGPNANHFKISNAITFDGKSIHLKYIDFIKVQTGLNTTAGWLGENSTEVLRFIDMHLKK